MTLESITGLNRIEGLSEFVDGCIVGILIARTMGILDQGLDHSRSEFGEGLGDAVKVCVKGIIDLDGVAGQERQYSHVHENSDMQYQYLLDLAIKHCQ